MISLLLGENSYLRDTELAKFKAENKPTIYDGQMLTIEKFIEIALKEAELALSEGEVPVGAVVTHKGIIVGRGHNLVEAEGKATRHAEIIALEEASIKLQGWRLNDCEMYVTMEPCVMCIGAMINSRVTRVYFGCKDPRMGACGSIFDLSAHPSLPHSIEVIGGLCEKEATELLQKFFKRIR